MIFSKPNALVFVQRSGLLVTGKHIAPARLDFPDNLVINMEIIDRARFVQLCQDFFASHELRRKRVLVVLDNSLVFRKDIALDESGQPDVLTEAFVSAIPFEPGDRICLSLRSKKALLLLATNPNIYDAVACALEGAGIRKIKAITPAAAYDLQGVDRKISSLATYFLKDTKIFKIANLDRVQPL